jgi:hypothetical protein
VGTRLWHAACFGLEVVCAGTFTVLSALTLWQQYRMARLDSERTVVPTTVIEIRSPSTEVDLGSYLVLLMLGVLAVWALSFRGRIRELSGAGLVWLFAVAGLVLLFVSPLGHVYDWAGITLIGLVHLGIAVRLLQVSRRQPSTA